MADENQENQGGYWAFRRECIRWAKAHSSEHRRVEMVVTVGASMAACGVALFSGETVWKVVIYSISGGIFAYIAIWLYFLILAPSNVYDKVRAAQQEAVAERDRYEAVLTDVDEWDENDTLLSRSIELGRQIEEDGHPDHLGSDMRWLSDQVMKWVLDVHSALESVDPKWAKRFSADGHVDLTGLNWMEVRGKVPGYILRLEEIREAWSRRHPSVLRD